MRASTLALFFLPVVFAAPIPNPGIFGDIGKAIGDLKNGGASLGGVAGAIGDSIKRPGLLIARVQVVTGLNNAQKDLASIVTAADKSKNEAVSTGAKAAAEGIKTAKGGVDAIGKAIFSGKTPERADQATVAAGIKKAQDAVKALEAAIVNKDAALSKLIAKADKDVALARKGGEGVLAASGLKFEDVGIADPDAPAAPPAADAPPAAEAPAAEEPAAGGEEAAAGGDQAAVARALSKMSDKEIADALNAAIAEEEAQQKATVPNDPIPE